MSRHQVIRRIKEARIPIMSDVAVASGANWREALKEMVVVLFFNLMPMWLGLIIVLITAVPDSAPAFIDKFASSSDLGILSASLLGSLLYTMFRNDDEDGAQRRLVRFPSGLWLVMLIIGCGLIATVIYSFTYISSTGSLYASDGSPMKLVEANSVAFVSWIIFAVAIIVMTAACTIRNSLDSQIPRMMSGSTQDFVDEYQADRASRGETE